MINNIVICAEKITEDFLHHREGNFLDLNVDKMLNLFFTVDHFYKLQ